MPSDKEQKRLKALLDAFDSGAVQPDDLMKAIDAVMAVLDSNSKTLADKMVEHKVGTDGDIKALRADLKAARDNLKAVIADVKNGSDSSLLDVKASLLKEIARVERNIPVLPPETDLSEVFEHIEEVRNGFANLSTLILGENIRNALEALQGEDRLDKSAIRGLDEALDEIRKAKGSPAAVGVRLLKYLADVNVEGITDGQSIVWDSATGKFIAGSAGGGYTNLTEFIDQTAWRLFYSDANGDVTELALGANGTFLKSNGASSAPSFAVPSGSGDVSKVGTPVNNQVGVWTGDGTLEGDAALTFDTTDDTLTVGGNVVTPIVRASSSAGLILQSNSGTQVADFGAGGGSNATFAGGVNIDGTTRLATSLTGPLRADSGVVSVGTDSVGITRSVVVTSGSATMGATALTDYVYLVAGAHTMTLPTAVSNTNRYTVKNNHSAAITVDTTSAQTIDGTTTISINPQSSVDIISNNSNWFII